MSVRSSGSGRGSAGSTSSQAGSRSGSQAGSPTRGSEKPSGFQEGTGVDPGRDRPALTPTELLSKRVDLPADAFKTGKEVTRFTARPGFTTQGDGIKVHLNIFNVASWADMEIYQYDVSVSPNPRDSNALVKKVWKSKTVTAGLGKIGGKWLYDGSKLAWSSQKIERGEVRFTVDLDSPTERPEAGQNVAGGTRTSVYSIRIRQTTTIRLSYLKAYLEGKIDWDAHVLECLNFFDHCLRQFPSEKWVTIKRNFYDPMFPVGRLSNDLVVNQGIYCAPRLSETVNRGGTGLTINVDRCQTAFWPVDSLDQIAFRLVNGYNEEWSKWPENQIIQRMRHKFEVKDGKTKVVPSEVFALLRRMSKLKFTVKHRGKMTDAKPYTVKRIVFDPDHGDEGTHSYNVTFDMTVDGQTKKVRLYDYYQDKYGIRLKWPKLPIIETSRGHLFPMELCNSIEHQRYSFRLNPRQTSDMIKAAATRPPKRSSDIAEGIKHLRWQDDPYLKAYGIKINPQMMLTDARIIKNPEVAFSNQKVDPGTSGRWDLRGKRFLEPNTTALKNWSFICCGTACRQNELENFARKFSDIYRGHGGQIAGPAFCKTIAFMDGNYATITEKAYRETSLHFKGDPQIMFFVLPTKNQLVYERLKKSMDCRYNLVSQCLQATHVQKASPQYMSNVAMKVNSKLGGVTCKVHNQVNPASPPFWSRPTMMIGVDVSHGAAGSQQPSMAAMSMSMDRNATRFAAACQTNGWRQETVLPTTMHMMLPTLVKRWTQINKCQPMHVYYLRDGVSEGQFQDVIDTEISEMRRIFREQGCGTPRFTVIIATKRHHVRFFPKQGDKKAADRNCNPLPGVLVERDVTHPKHFDFYLCSHAAIQGTARPVHYQVILDEAGCKPNELTKMIYQQCYQYCRSTTPVSLHPAVYYSHLASNRARCHESIASDSLILAFGKPGFPYAKGGSEVYTGDQPAQAPPLLPMGKNMNDPKIQFMNTTMWYV